jgi:site-specific DNA-cytosine methylase
MRDAVASGAFALRANYNTNDTNDEGLRRTKAEFDPAGPAPTLTGKVAEWRWVNTRTLNGVIDAHAGPALSITGKVPGQWVHDHPATTVMADARIRPPGHHTERQPPGTVRVSNAELGVLQGFPPDYPWTGPHIGQQIGNAVPPPLAAAILGALTA